MTKDREILEDMLDELQENSSDNTSPLSEQDTVEIPVNDAGEFSLEGSNG